MIKTKNANKSLGFDNETDLIDKLDQRGITRREFLKFCTIMAATLALPSKEINSIANALSSVKRPSVIYLHFQDCTADTEALVRSPHPSITDIVLDLISIDYHETIMAAAGSQAEDAKEAIIKEGGYILVIEGSIPLKDNGIYCCIGGKTALYHLVHAASNAVAVLAAGNCSSFGNLPAAYPNPTGAVGVRDIIKGIPIVNIAGCPCNAISYAGVIVHYITYKSLPSLDSQGRPLFAYGKRIHDHCERRAHFDAGEYVEQWGDEGHRQGWCLYKMGCKGPATYHNCPAIRYNSHTNWPIGSGHGCVGCSEVDFFDTMTPFYKRLPDVQGFGASFDANKVAIGFALASTALVGGHAIGSAIRSKGGEQTIPLDSEEHIMAEEANKQKPNEDHISD